jgi:hypothetical protein
MFNNQGTEAKYNITVPLDGTAGVKGELDGLPVYAETSIRVEIFDVGPTNVTYIQGRLRNSPNWHEIATVTGESNAVYDVSTYDFVRYVILVADGVGTIVSAGFFFSYSSGGSSVTAWGDITGTLSNQTDLQSALDLKESLSNKATDLTSPDNTKYPTTLAVDTAISSISQLMYYTAGRNTAAPTTTIPTTTYLSFGMVLTTGAATVYPILVDYIGLENTTALTR